MAPVPTGRSTVSGGGGCGGISVGGGSRPGWPEDFRAASVNRIHLSICFDISKVPWGLAVEGGPIPPGMAVRPGLGADKVLRAKGSGKGLVQEPSG